MTLQATFDFTQGYHHNHPMSDQAHDSIKHHKKVLLERVVRYIESKGLSGATCDEIEQALNLSHQTASARMTEAKAFGRITWLGDKRKTRSGRNAAVLVIKGEK